MAPVGGGGAHSNHGAGVHQGQTWGKMWSPGLEKNAEKMRKMRQNMRRKIWFSCHGVCLPQTPMFVKAHVDLLTTIALFKRLRPRLNTQSVAGNHTLLLWFKRRGVAVLNPSLRPLLHSLNRHCMLFAVEMTLDGALGGSRCNTLHREPPFPLPRTLRRVGVLVPSSEWRSQGGHRIWHVYCKMKNVGNESGSVGRICKR